MLNRELIQLLQRLPLDLEVGIEDYDFDAVNAVMRVSVRKAVWIDERPGKPYAFHRASEEGDKSIITLGTI